MRGSDPRRLRSGYWVVGVYTPQLGGCRPRGIQVRVDHPLPHDLTSGGKSVTRCRRPCTACISAYITRAREGYGEPSTDPLSQGRHPFGTFRLEGGEDNVNFAHCPPPRTCALTVTLLGSALQVKQTSVHDPVARCLAHQRVVFRRSRLRTIQVLCIWVRSFPRPIIR